MADKKKPKKEEPKTKKPEKKSKSKEAKAGNRFFRVTGDSNESG